MLEIKTFFGEWEKLIRKKQSVFIDTFQKHFDDKFHSDFYLGLTDEEPNW
ncbi:hypothetical protein N5B56_01510 [Eubacterium sp. LFL-14]|jgi:hypothetical protein|uniref:Uncharacterized protein n=1 Tax=Eubacterium album TaxID=2978477 RepID=A0ABT2M0J5_9FIRM|nr:hypothetical protein [Eubacterium sp. LFL-14]MCT7397763.1 hypothetical protein [Eubacterium sp. LFL-14]